MIEDDRYCIDISNQVLATISLLNKANREIIPGGISQVVCRILSLPTHRRNKTPNWTRS